MELPVHVAEILQDAYHLCTDGSFTGYRHNRTAHSKHKREATRRPEIRGWGAAFFERGPPPSEQQDAVPGIGIILTGPNFDGTLKGRVTTLREESNGEKGYVGGDAEDKQHR